MKMLQVDIRHATISVIVLISLGCSNKVSVDTTTTLAIEQTTFPTTTTTSTATSSPTSTITPTSTSTPIPSIITPTSLPTISPSKIDQAISELVHTNGGCSLPCFWGITPGKTSWLEANQILNKYNAEISLVATDEVKIENDYRMVDYYDVILYSSEFPDGKYADFNVIDKYHLYTISSYHSSNDPIFLLSSILLNNGKPDLVFIQTYANVPSFDYPFNVILFYSGQNFAAGYRLSAKKQGNNIVWCPYSTPPNLWIWSDDISKYVEPEDIMRRMVGDITPRFKPIEEVTKYSVESFYQEFRYPSRDVCIETSTTHWEQ
jgi:hypothetical protein